MLDGRPDEHRKYAPRGKGPTVLQVAMQEGLSAFLADVSEAGGLPGFVVREFRAATTCGDPALGFVRVKCNQCGEELHVAFTCRGRTVCPSCTARRAACTAAHLVDEVLPEIPYRQWTLAFPRGLKVALASDPALMGAALRIFVAVIFAWQRRQARQLGFEKPRPGAIVFVQNFTGALLLHPHAHVLVPEGVFCAEDTAFAELPPPDDAEVEALLRRVAKKVVKLAQATYPEGLPHTEDALAALAAASAQTRLALGDEENAWPGKERRCAFLEGFSLHANTSVHANDRAGLETLCRYGARGPLTLERLSLRPDGKLEYRLKKPIRGGATTLVMTALQLLKRLCALVVKPRIHLTRFFGVFAPNSNSRADVVPQRPAPPPPPPAPPPAAATPGEPTAAAEPHRPRPYLNWADLLRRTWGFDVFACPCGGRRRILAFITSPELSRQVLGLPARNGRPQPTGPPQLALALP